ncbi:hypothetical protein OG497_09325 [Streptomyces sp. NBC_01242]|uniref:hypothetical protein n=1 Tax=unclassified Streptomyces TaxID=2593676 RepID=UPI00224E62FD|nr:hypothetical protein [Streptomyces sp. NBC_01242]MCX4794317.1 hypothetical protein [Streptomyces sp. NBC_01242]WSU21216.1 hypothetical protein OG508_09640 [Streptomyces sp. NBC_01108]
MKLDLPDASVRVVDGTFAFVWRGSGALDMSVDRCASLRTRAHGHQGEVQLIFQFRLEGAETGGMVIVRIDVPAQYAASAERFMTEARVRYGIVTPEDDSNQEETVSRIPRDDPHWINAPAHADSEGLYGEIFDRIAAEPAS